MPASTHGGVVLTPRGFSRGRHVLSIPVPGGPTGRDRIDAIVHRGRQTSPSFAVVAGVHGDEVEGIRAVHHVDRWLSTHPPEGSVLLIPVANPAGFRAGTRRHPPDQLDLNRAFPGNPEGSPGERLAATLFGAVSRWQFVLSLHSWFVHGSVTPYVEVASGPDATARESRVVAEQLGLDLIRLSEWHPGLLVASANHTGIPAVEVEVGGLGRLDPENADLYPAVIRRALAARSVTNEETASVRAGTYRHHYLAAAVGGLFVREAGLRESVRTGQRVGAVVDLLGRTRQVIRARKPGLIAGYREHPAVHAGDNLFYIFTAAAR